ncbi:hypothetical protein ACFQZS_08965 [Mucilaginibacter calamicampi]|uniref:Uncharacterized protein n=1 Tax=Mucilaginibacter calamicampi TaxID=1302352 RepID=A0ABW2YV05_9SPHI
MKKNQIRPLGGLYLALLFIFNISLVAIAVIKNDDIYVAYAILISCFQFYICHKSRVFRILFSVDTPESQRPMQPRDAHKKEPKYHEIHLN